jgi:putative spermidine/putrescine transport system substrate-binding protein
MSLSTRREFLAGAAGSLVACLPITGCGGRGPAREELVFVSWGGVLSTTERDAFMSPAGQALGISIITSAPTNYAKIKAMVQGGDVEWDLVDVGGPFMYQGRDQGLLEEIDYRLVDVSGLDREWYGSHGVYTATGATVMAWNETLLPDGQAPRSWRDFWDVKRLPGARGLFKQFDYNYEAALMSAGVARTEIYPATTEKAELALARLREIRPHVSVWWGAGAQPAQLLSTGELVLSSAWSGRIQAVRREGAPVSMTFDEAIAWGNAYVVPKGTRHRELAMRVINYCVSEPAQRRLLGSGIYGPVLPAAVAKASASERLLLVTAPENLARMVVMNAEQAAIYAHRYEDAWTAFQAS